MIKRAVTKVRSSTHKKKIKIAAAIVCIIVFSGYFYYYPAPSSFDKTNILPISIAILFFFSTIFTTLTIFIATKKAFLITLILTSTLFITHIRIIPIVTYAICFPLLILDLKKQSEKTNSTTRNL